MTYRLRSDRSDLLSYSGVQNKQGEFDRQESAVSRCPGLNRRPRHYQ